MNLLLLVFEHFIARPLTVQGKLNLLHLPLQLDKLSVSADMRFLLLFIPINPDFPGVLFGRDLLVLKRNLINQLLALNLILF